MSVFPDMPPQLRSFFPEFFWNWWQAFKVWVLGVSDVANNGVPGPAGPTGPTGPAGPPGSAGSDGPAGPGVPVGGTTGQVLAKNSNSSYDTYWTDGNMDILAGYRISDIDSAGNPNYYGFEDASGNWYIMQYYTDVETFRYAKGASGYTAGWSGRAGLSYTLFETTF